MPSPSALPLAPTSTHMRGPAPASSRPCPAYKAGRKEIKGRVYYRKRIAALERQIENCEGNCSKGMFAAEYQASLDLAREELAKAKKEMENLNA